MSKIVKRDRRTERRARYLSDPLKAIEADRRYRERKKRAAEALRKRQTAKAAREAAKLEKARQRQRKRYSRDFLAFYRDCYASNVTSTQTGKLYRDSLGPIHPFIVDFLNMNLKNVERHSALWKYMPKDCGTHWEERWLYWPTLKSSPTIQDGPEGLVSKMFHTTGWQGVVVRIKGKYKRAMQLPRSHLKSEIITKAHTLWRICREPADRNLIQSRDQLFARNNLMAGIKERFEWPGTKFHDLYGHLKPTGADHESWAKDYIQVKCPNTRGGSPTVASFGFGSSTTGTHVEMITLDDLIVPETTGGIDDKFTQATNLKIQRLVGVLDPGSVLQSVGTPWAANDGHSLFTKPDGPFYGDSSFFVATLVDANPEGSIPREYCLCSRGDPIWPERFTLPVIKEIRRGMPIDQEYFGQYFCQFFGTSAKLFHPDWITYYDENPRVIAKVKKCRIFMSVDTASGKTNGIKKGKFDPTGMLVLGQSTLDPTDYYVLDGLKEHIAAEDMAGAIVDMAVHWKQFADANDLEFVMGVEDTAYTTLLKPLIEHELTDRGLEGFFPITPLLHNNRQKESRIRVLAGPHSRKWIAWPKKLIKASKRGPHYDLAEELRGEFVDYPMVAHEELLDCEAYCFELSGLRDYPDRPAGGKKAADPSRYDRKEEATKPVESDGVVELEHEPDLVSELYSPEDEGWEDALG